MLARPLWSPPSSLLTLVNSLAHQPVCISLELSQAKQLAGQDIAPPTSRLVVLVPSLTHQWADTRSRTLGLAARDTWIHLYLPVSNH